MNMSNSIPEQIVKEVQRGDSLYCSILRLASNYKDIHQEYRCKYYKPIPEFDDTHISALEVEKICKGLAKNKIMKSNMWTKKILDGKKKVSLSHLLDELIKQAPSDQTRTAALDYYVAILHTYIRIKEIETQNSKVSLEESESSKNEIELNRMNEVKNEILQNRKEIENTARKNNKEDMKEIKDQIQQLQTLIREVHATNEKEITYARATKAGKSAVTRPTKIKIVDNCPMEILDSLKKDIDLHGNKTVVQILTKTPNLITAKMEIPINFDLSNYPIQHRPWIVSDSKKDLVSKHIVKRVQFTSGKIDQAIDTIQDNLKVHGLTALIQQFKKNNGQSQIIKIIIDCANDEDKVKAYKLKLFEMCDNTNLKGLKWWKKK